MSSKPRHPLYFPKMKLRGSERRRAQRFMEAYILSGQAGIDMSKFQDALVKFVDSSYTLSISLDAFIDSYITDNLKQSDFALAAPSNN